MELSKRREREGKIYWATHKKRQIQSKNQLYIQCLASDELKHLFSLVPHILMRFFFFDIVF